MSERIYELAAQIHQIMSQEPKISRYALGQRLKASTETINQMEREGIIPQIYRPTKAEHTQRKKDGGGWKSGLDFDSRGNK
jgi:primosomal protein N'